eukprot:12887763-Alexandrium_andersonii.AAC.1
MGWPATSVGDPVGAGATPDLGPMPSTEPPCPSGIENPKTEREGGPRSKLGSLQKAQDERS